MTYDYRDDWSGDEHQGDRGVHYRLYLSPHTGAPVVICVQDFDYLDYDARLIISPEAWSIEGLAEAALLDLAPTIAACSRTVHRRGLDPELHRRLLARSIRGSEVYQHEPLYGWK